MRAAEQGRQAVAAAMSERELDEAVRALAAGLGLLAYHTRDSRRSAAGFPDWVIAGPRCGLVFAECKAQRGRLSADQKRWGEVLLGCGQAWYVWRPADLVSGEIARILSGAAGLKIAAEFARAGLLSERSPRLPLSADTDLYWLR
ncbi:MAG: hypothetical protein J2P28_23985 [Actinobacteria bacterium]|nr:hypothetical protein [Actinomycetota bacterium]